jgi:hypothetical protein
MNLGGRTRANDTFKPKKRSGVGTKYYYRVTSGSGQMRKQLKAYAWLSSLDEG